jgi:hypothetical protein
MNANEGRLPGAVLAAVGAALALFLEGEPGRYRVTAVRPLGPWSDPGSTTVPWGAVGRQEAAFVRQHFGEGRRP